jgi:hypothetical protein
MVTISEHVASLAPLIHSTRPQAVDDTALFLWSIDVTMSVLGVDRSEALLFVRRTTNR